jgi:hypothetical protein
LPQTEEEYRKTFESEKARTVILLGFLSIILTVRVELHDGDFWNFPCNSPCPHITLLLLPTFTNWIISWLGYIACMLVYVSEDKFDKYTWSRSGREFVRRLGYLFIWWYPVTVLFFSGFGGLSFQLPDSVQTPYWLTVVLLFGAYLIWTAEETVGTKIVGRRGVLTQAVGIFLEFGYEGMKIIAEGLALTWRKILRGFGHPKTGPTNLKQAMRIFITTTETIVISIAYFAFHLSGYNLLYAFGVPIYALIFASAIVGWLRKRKPK